MKQSLKAMCVAVLACSVFSVSADAAPIKGSSMETAKLTMVQEWDKVFAQSDKVTHKKVTLLTVTASHSQPICMFRKTPKENFLPLP